MDQHTPDPNRPQAPPPSRESSTYPGWGYPEGYVPPAAPPPLPARPAQVTAAAVILIVLGVLVALFGALSLLAGAVFPSISESADFRDQFGDLSSALGGLLLVFGILLLGFGVLQVITGMFVLPGRPWARISGLVLAVLGILFSLVGVLPGEGSGGGSVVFGVLLLAYGFCAWVLASKGGWFAR
ncbi:MAG TPA: hypothetical protein VF071_02000 [Candidatus Limnocylindria bacterium]